MFSRYRALLRVVPALLLIGWLLLPDPAPQDGRVHISYWEKWGSFEGDAMRAVVDGFNRSQDRIFVDYLSVSQIEQKTLLATAGGNPPDVVGLAGATVHVYADNGALTPLDERCKQDKIGPDDYLPAYWGLTQHRGKTWALPTTPVTIGLYWNKQHFRKAGLDPDKPPKTLEELDRMAEQLTIKEGDRIAQMGFLPSEPGWWKWAWGYFFGGELWDGKDRITADSPENIEAFRWVQSYGKKYGTSSISSFQSGFGNFNSPLNAFMSGKVSIVLQGVWMSNFIQMHNPTMEWGAASFPYPADRPDLANSTMVDMDVLAIPTGARHPDEAWEFIRFVQSQAGMELLCLGQRKHSPLSTVTPNFYKQHPHPRVDLFYDLAREGRAFHTPKLGIWREYQAEMNNAFDKIWTQGIDPAIALADVRKRMQPKMDKELERIQRRGWTTTPETPLESQP